MIFEHVEYNLANDIDDNQMNENSQLYIFLDDNVDDDNSKIVAQAISLDIRGNFGFFLNKKYTDMCESYEWKGNLFRIVVNSKEQMVSIQDITEEENNEVYSVDLVNWEEALTDWKDFYLNKLGFNDCFSVAASHIIGVLLLTYDQMDESFCSDEMIIEAIKKCSERYGVNASVIYRDCRKVAGVYSIELFYDWVIELFENRTEHSLLYQFIVENIDTYYSDIRYSIIKHFEIEL